MPAVRRTRSDPADFADPCFVHGSTLSGARRDRGDLRPVPTRTRTHPRLPGSARGGRPAHLSATRGRAFPRSTTPRCQARGARWSRDRRACADLEPAASDRPAADHRRAPARGRRRQATRATSAGRCGARRATTRASRPCATRSSLPTSCAAEGWGPGSRAGVAAAPELLGERDDPGDFEPGIRMLDNAHRRNPGPAVPPPPAGSSKPSRLRSSSRR